MASTGFGELYIHVLFSVQLELKNWIFTLYMIKLRIWTPEEFTQTIIVIAKIMSKAFFVSKVTFECY